MNVQTTSSVMTVKSYVSINLSINMILRFIHINDPFTMAHILYLIT